MNISVKLYQLEQAAERRVVPPKPDRHERGRTLCAEHILSTMAEEHVDYIILEIKDSARATRHDEARAPQSPLFRAFLNMAALMYSELLRDVEPRVYAIPPAIAEQYLAQENHARAPIGCDCADCGLIHPRWTPHHSEMPPCVLCGGHVGLNAWHIKGRGRMIAGAKHEH